MAADTNRQWRVARYPAADETIGAGHFAWHEAAIPSIADGEFLVRTICLAPIPAQRGYLQESHAGFFANVPVGEVMRGRGIGQIIGSRHPDYPAGGIFIGSLGWQDYSVQQPRGAEFVFSTKLVTQPVRPLTLHMGILGQAGATAWFGLHEAGALKSGDNVLVSAAAGGVGSCAAQIARIRGAGRVVGMTGSAEKCRWLTDELGLDAAIDYRRDNVGARLADEFPEGIDVFFDCVGGDLLDQGLAHLAMHARVVICGYIATDYAPGTPAGPANYRNLLRKRARMQGFVVFDYWDRFAEAEDDLRRWYRQGALHNTEDVDDGLERMPDALASLFSGGNRGVKLCRVSPDAPAGN